MNKPFSEALKNLHRESTKADDAATSDVPDRGVIPVHNEIPVSEDTLVAEDTPGPFAADLPADQSDGADCAGCFELDGDNNVADVDTREPIELIDPTVVADVGVPTSAVPTETGGSFDTTDVSFSIADQLSSAGADEATATATGAIITKIMERKRNTTASESNRKTAAEFASKIRDIPHPDQMASATNETETPPATVTDQQPIDSTSSEAANVTSQPLDNGQLVLEEADLLRASKDRVLVVPRDEKLVIRPSDLVSRQEAMAKSSPESSVSQVTAVAFSADAVPVVEQYARNPTQNPTIPISQSATQDRSRNRNNDYPMSPLPARESPGERGTKTAKYSSNSPQPSDNGEPNKIAPPAAANSQTAADHAWTHAIPDDGSPSLSEMTPPTDAEELAGSASSPSTPSETGEEADGVLQLTRLDADEGIATVAHPPRRLTAGPSLSFGDSSQRQLSKIKSEPRPPATALQAKVGEYLKKASLVEQFGLLAEMIIPPDPSKVKTIALAHLDEMCHAHEALIAVARVLGTQRSTDTLIVDADVDRAGLTNQLALDHEEGFGEACDRHQLWLHLVKPTAVPGVFFLPAGSCADQSLLEPNRLQRVFVEFSRGPFSVVLIYAGDVSEYRTRSLCEAADEAFVLVRLGRTDRVEAQQRIRNSQIHFDGCIVTNATRHIVLSD